MRIYLPKYTTLEPIYFKVKNILKDIENFNNLLNIFLFNLDGQCGIINILLEYLLLVFTWEGDPFDNTYMHLLFNDVVECFPNKDKKDNCISLPNTSINKEVLG